MQHEITERGPLLNEQGELAQRGWARAPLLDYNPENVNVMPVRALNRFRLKEWDYYGITTPTHFFAVSVASVGYMGLAFAYLIDFERKTMIEKTIATPFGMRCNLPRSSETGDILFEWGGVRIEFRRGRETRDLSIHWPRFANGQTLSSELHLTHPADMEFVVMATPIGRRHFYYNHKINCLPVEGSLNLGQEKTDLTGGQSCLDWGRGVWEYSTFWNWASASGRLPDGRRIGLNLGRGFGDLSKATENAAIVEGKVSKLDDVQFDYDPKNYMRPWIFSDSESKLRLTFTPFYERITRVNAVVLFNEVHQMFGKYSGFAVTGANERIEIRDLIGWAEECRAKW